MKPDVTIPSHPNPTVRDAHRRGRVQEGVAIALALLILVTTLVVGTTSVAGGTVPSASRTDAVRPGCEHAITIVVVADGSTASDRICSFGPSSATDPSG